MAAGKYNFIVEQGSIHVLTFTYSDDLDQPIDLTGMSVRMSVKDNLSYTAFVYRATSDTNVDTDTDFFAHFSILPQGSSTLGQFKLEIPSTITDGFTFNQGVYDLEVVAGTSVTRLLGGKFKIKLQVSV